MQGGDDVHLRRQLVRGGRLLHRQVEKSHAFKTQALRQRARLVDEFGTGFDAVDMSALLLAGMRDIEKQVVKNEAKIGLAGPVVGQGERPAVGRDFLQQRCDELVQVVDLLELAPRVLVELALAGEDVQLLEQLDGLARPEFFNDLDGFGRRCVAGRRLAGGLACAWGGSVLHGPPV